MKMIKHTSLFKWPQNGSSKSLELKSTKQQQQSQKLWLHPPATLQNGHIAYLVKYFGNVEINQPKGIEVVKESINKLKLIQPIKKAEGNKTPKVELTISVNGVAIQEPKSKKIYCQFPLHRISYCADDKTEKKFFSFIAKDVDTDKHLCFVFMSEKMSEEIILTIGQAFDLAYAKFIETSGRELEIRKQLIMLQKRVYDLEEENKKLKERLNKYEPDIVNPNLLENCSEDNSTAIAKQNGNSKPNKSNIDVPVPALHPPPVFKNRNNQGTINLIDVDLEYDEIASVNNTTANKTTSINDLLDEDFNPRADDKIETLQNESNENKVNNNKTDVFGSEPFQIQDPFGMGQFSAAELNSAIVSIDKKLAEMRDGFSQGLSADGFNMDS